MKKFWIVGLVFVVGLLQAEPKEELLTSEEWIAALYGTDLSLLRIALEHGVNPNQPHEWEYFENNSDFKDKRSPIPHSMTPLSYIFIRYFRHEEENLAGFYYILRSHGAYLTIDDLPLIFKSFRYRIPEGANVRSSLKFSIWHKRVFDSLQTDTKVPANSLTYFIPFSNPPFYYYGFNDSMQLIQTLIDYGADPNYRDSDENPQNCSRLHIRIFGNKDSRTLMLKNGAKFNPSCEVEYCQEFDEKEKAFKQSNRYHEVSKCKIP